MRFWRWILCKEIQSLYVKKGYFLVRVFPPVQVVKEGLLRIDVLEVTVGAIQIEGNKHYTDKFIRKYFSKFEGRCIQYDELVKKILLLNEFSDLNVGVAFQRGQVPGTTDMIVRVIDGRPIHFYADYNNYGSSVTALKRTGARAEFGNTLMSGDDLTLIGVMGFPYKDLQFIDGIYTLPLNASGTFMEFATLYSNFHVNRLKPLHLRGDTLDVTVGISQAMKRTQRLSATLFAAFDYLEEFYIGGITTVRGFPMASALGDSGFSANVEARIPAPFFRSCKVFWSKKKKWGDVLQLITFVDHGEVYVISGHGVVGQTGRVYMTSTGLGARIFAPWGIDVNLDWGFPLSHQERSSDSIFYVKVSKRFL